jgi:hypothetical protein
MLLLLLLLLSLILAIILFVFVLLLRPVNSMVKSVAVFEDGAAVVVGLDD